MTTGGEQRAAMQRQGQRQGKLRVAEEQEEVPSMRNELGNIGLATSGLLEQVKDSVFHP